MQKPVRSNCSDILPITDSSKEGRWTVMARKKQLQHYPFRLKPARTLLSRRHNEDPQGVAQENLAETVRLPVAGQLRSEALRQFRRSPKSKGRSENQKPSTERERNPAAARDHWILERPMPSSASTSELPARMSPYPTTPLPAGTLRAVLRLQLLKCALYTAALDEPWVDRSDFDLLRVARR